MFLCTNGVELKVLPFPDNRHLGSIPRFQRFSCSDMLSVVMLCYKIG